MELHRDTLARTTPPSPVAVAAGLFAVAEVVLITSEGTLGERVHIAYGELGRHAVDGAPSLPAPLALAVADLHTSLTDGGVVGEEEFPDVLSRSIASMSQAELQRAALSICTLADFLNQALEDERVRHRGVRSTCRHCGAGTHA